MRDPALKRIRHRAILETTSDDLLAVLRGGSSSTNHYLRRLHNLAIGLGWLNWPILPPRLWPKVEWRKKRGIAWEEHQKIISTEINPERCLFYKLLWEIGGSQTDVATLTADNIDWEGRLLWYRRHKLKRDAEPARITIGEGLEQTPASIARSRSAVPPLGQSINQRPRRRIPPALPHPEDRRREPPQLPVCLG